MKDNIGIGVVLKALSGNEETIKTLKESLDKEITALVLEDNELKITFKDGTKIALFDGGQSCCENRYMNTDDTLTDYVGAKLQGVEVAPGPELPCEYDLKESQFLKVETSKGTFTVVNYNEHNGYYGGFYIEAKRIS